MQARHDLGRQALGAVDAIEGAAVDRLQPQLLEGGHLRQLGQALGRGHRQRGEPARLDEGQGRGQVVEDDGHLARHRIVERRARAPVGHMRERQPRAAGHQLHQHVAYGARARRAVGMLAGVLLHLVHEGRKALRLEARMHGQHIGRGRNVGDGREIGERVVGQARVDGRIGGRGGHGGHAQRVAVGLGARGLVRADGASAAALVVHHQRLAQGLGHARRNRARHDVGGAAGRKRHDQAHRARGIGAGIGRHGARCGACGQQQGAQAAA